MAEKEQSVEDLQRQVLQAQLARETASLEETVENNAERKQKREVAARTNAQRQRQFAQDRSNLRAIQHRCEHRAGGYAGETDILEGDGHSVLSVTIMPDGHTKFLQCPRCRLSLYGRLRTKQEEARMKKAAEAVMDKNPKGYESDPNWLKWDNHQWWMDLMKVHKKFAIKKSIMRGPTFNFQNSEGMSVIPELR
jgi:hypothetical protein